VIQPIRGGRLYRFLYRISTERVDIERFWAALFSTDNSRKSRSAALSGIKRH